MATVSRLDLSTFPDSPYAAELQRRSSNLCFSPALEAEYRHACLLNSRTLIRVACVFAAILTLIRGMEQLFRSASSPLLLLDISLVLGTSVALTVISWGPAFERLYPRWAQIVIPLRNSVIAAQVAAAAAHGQPEMLMALPITLIGPFFFLGLPLRSALFVCVVTVTAYIVAANFFGLSQAMALHSYVLLLGGVVACIIAVWHLEKVSRQSFLEGRLIAELAQRDPLTGTKNRRVFDESLEQLWQRAVAKGRGLAILLIDIDHFKAYNDRYGHQAGDEALRRVAQTVQRVVRRPQDVLTRYGGEEFAVILYDVDRKLAMEAAERIRLAVRELNIEHDASATLSSVTISVGVAAVEPTEQRDPRGALQLADQALYEAKVKGRNRVELMDAVHHSLLETGVFAVDVTPAPRLASNSR